MSTQRKKLPIGIQTFSEIREENYYYVDKTPFALQLIEQGKHYFLSRPRRFGKSLLIDTLKELFEGNQELFCGLHAEKHWDWSIQYPVLRLGFGRGMVDSKETLEKSVVAQLQQIEKKYGLQAEHKDHLPSRIYALLESLHDKSGQRVVVLVDEYDKPILDHLTRPETAIEMRDQLRSLYSVFKDADAHVKFVFITGVSKFSKVSLFSGLNNLLDITISPDYSALCGYTQNDLEKVFAPEMEGLEWAEIRRWYNGYNWQGEAVYNPFDILLYFRQGAFRPYWFETGTPTFLVDYLSQQNWFTPDFMQLEVSPAILSRFDIDEIAPEALLWQTGYLTFHKTEEIMTGQWVYTLGYPNREVESALNESLLHKYGTTARPAFQARSALLQALMKNDMQALKESIHALFASIPHDWYRKNPLAQFEGHYASVFYSQLAALGLNVQGEDVTNKGRIDLSLKLENRVYLFEFKVIDGAPDGSALQQLIERDYAAKYRAPDVEITLIGIEFGRSERNVVGFETQTGLEI